MERIEQAWRERAKALRLEIAHGEMAGMRDRLIHFYFGVDHRLVWQTLTDRLPHLIRQVRHILESLA